MTAPLHAGTGGASHSTGRPHLVFVHGAGMDRTVWAHQARYFAHHGWNVLAIDLPGHGRSAGQACASVPAYAAALRDDLDAKGIERAALVGHSMGALVALVAAAEAPGLTTALGLLGAGLALAVNPRLLSATEHAPAAAAGAIVAWGYGREAHLGGAQPPGAWLDGGGLALLRAGIAAHPGTLAADFAATAAFDAGPAGAASVTCPTLVVAGGHDQMTPPRLARALADAIRGASLVELPACGHMLMVERPRQVTALLHDFLEPVRLAE